MLRKTILAGGTLVACGVAVALYAQPPGPPRGNAGGGVAPAVERLMAFDANKDGKLSKEELNDERLTALFQRADANQDGTVTQDELTAQLTKDAAALGGGRGGPEGDRGPGGPPPGAPAGGGPGGFGPPRSGHNSSTVPAGRIATLRRAKEATPRAAARSRRKAVTHPESRAASTTARHGHSGTTRFRWTGRPRCRSRSGRATE